MVSNLMRNVLFAGALLALSPRAHPEDAATLTLPAHTEIQVRLQDRVSSATASQGQHFSLAVDADVLLQGRVVIPQGTPASGTVLAAERSGQMGAGGTLSVKLDYVQLGTQRVRLHWTFDSTDRSQERKARALNAIILPLGFAAAGKDIELPAGTLIRAYTKDSVDIVPATSAASAAPESLPATDQR